MSNEVRVTDPKTGGQKGQKDERFDLFPFDALEEISRVYAIGAKKYDDDNWLRGYRWRLSAGALLRHVSRFMCGEDRDPESGCLHLAHAAWHCLTLITFTLRKLGTDDRRPPYDATAHRYYDATTNEPPIELFPAEPAPMSVAQVNDPLEVPGELPDEVA